VLRRDPLADPAPLIRRVYAYAAYRLGDGPEAEDATSETFERALRYKKSYDPSKGEPVAWLLGIAKRCIDGSWSTTEYATENVDSVDTADVEEDTIRRLTVARAVATLDERDRELVALRYGADLTARQIAELLGARTNAIEVALHRALGRLRVVLGEEPEVEPVRKRGASR
jgi:RNA polymerase sigma factor (sigma-70 family)